MKEHIFEMLQPFLPAIYKALFMYLCVVVMIGCDLWSGIRKAKSKDIFIHSYGIDRTLDKLTKHLNLLLGASVIDAILIVAEINDFMMFPWVTFALSIIICIKELKSIWEKEEDKGRYIESAKIAKKVAENIKSGDIGILIDELAKNYEKKKQDENRTN